MSLVVNISRLQKRILYWKKYLVNNSKDTDELINDIRKLQLRLHKCIINGNILDTETLELESILNSQFESYRLFNAKNSAPAIKTEDLSLK